MGIISIFKDITAGGIVKFRHYLDNCSFSKKLLYTNLLSIVGAFIPVILIMITYEFYALRHATLTEIRLQSNIIADSSSATLAFKDKESANEILNALKQSKNLIEAHLLLANGEILGSIYHDSNDNNIKSTQYQASKKYIELISVNKVIINKPIYLKNGYVGNLVYVVDLKSFYIRIALYSVVIFISLFLGFIFARMVSSSISRSVTEPLTELINTTHQMTSISEISTLNQDKKSRNEVEHLTHAFNQMLVHIHKHNLSMQQLAYYDQVTGIANRRCFEEKIVQAVENSNKYGYSCFLFIIDLDDFKIVNDTLGHKAGDLVLQNVSLCLKNTMRTSDTYFRIGGDEFSLILEGDYGLDSIHSIARKLIQAIATPFFINQKRVVIGASIGICCFPTNSDSVETLIVNADTAMYHAKKSGKNNFIICENRIS